MIRRSVCVLALLGVLAGPAAAGPPAVEARAWLVENAATGEVLLAHDARTRMPIASITKLMTVLVALEHHRLTDVITVDPRVASVGEESLALQGGERLTVADLVRGALIQSANDAADALALATAPDFPSFAAKMNAKAQTLGLADTHFVRPDGLDAPGEYSTAHDVFLLARDAMRNPFIRQTVAKTGAVIGGDRALHTWNDLLGLVPGVIGVKTGHTAEAGWSQVAAERAHGVTLYATILGSPTRSRRDADLISLLAWGFGQYRLVQPVARGKALARVQLPFGRPPLELVAAKRLRAWVRVGRPLVRRVVAPVSTSLPVRQGEVLGHVQVWQDGRLVGRRPLVASRAVARPGLVGRLRWYARRTLHHLAGLFT
jgi:D-alanyl-D-alanine carboxypeptidase (penicillin-binding protein 5/6)